MRVVERGEKLGAWREQHPVPEHIARHVADPDGGELGGLDVNYQLTEVPLDRFPRAARGDSHLLVVVTVGPARGKRVAEPEAGADRNLVGDVRERGSSFVRRDYQVRIAFVAADHTFGRDDLSSGDVVGDVKQTGQERLIASDSLVQ